MTVHFIGAGPGAADLITLRAAQLLSEAQVCLYAGTYIEAVLQHCPTDCELVNTEHINLDEIVNHLVEAAKAGKEVVRLCSGDPSIYSALAEQTRRLDAAGVEWDVTPGVPAYCAAAAILGQELTVPEVAQSVILTRAQMDSTKMPESESLEYLGKSRATLALHLAIRHVPRLVGQIIDSYGPDCPAIVVANATQTNEQLLRGTLADIADKVAASGLRQAAVILVGWALDAEEFVDSHLYSSRCAASPDNSKQHQELT